MAKYDLTNIKEYKPPRAYRKSDKPLVPPKDDICPICGGKLIPRKSRYGEFLGCSNYNVNGCHYTVSYRKSNEKKENKVMNATTEAMRIEDTGRDYRPYEEKAPLEGMGFYFASLGLLMAVIDPIALAIGALCIGICMDRLKGVK